MKIKSIGTIFHLNTQLAFSLFWCCVFSRPAYFQLLFIQKSSKKTTKKGYACLAFVLVNKNQAHVIPFQSVSMPVEINFLLRFNQSRELRKIYLEPIPKFKKKLAVGTAHCPNS